MRFAFISSLGGAVWGGSEELWSRAALRLNEQGHKVSASVTWWPSPAKQIINLQAKGVGVFQRMGEPQSVIGKIWRNVARQDQDRKMRQWVRDQHADIVVISQGGISDGLRWMTACREMGQPFAVIVQCNAEAIWPKDDLAESMILAYKAAQRVYCVSHHNLDLLEVQLGVRLPNAEVVWNPFNVSTDRINPWPDETGGFKLACIARLEPKAKGQDMLLRLMSQEKWRQRPLEIDLFGSGPCERSLRRLADLLGLQNVHFCGHSDDIDRVWDEHHMLILPSRYEGLPLALTEAMWCSRPAIVTDVGGNQEVCVDEETGFVAEAAATDLLDSTLERAWNKRNSWQAMGLAARATAEKLIPKDPIATFCDRLTECTTTLNASDTRIVETVRSTI